jgi:seryl-tRNA synthetase
MTFQIQLTKFINMKNAFANKIHELTNEKASLEAQLSEAKASLNVAISMEIDEPEKAQAEQTKLKKAISKLEADLASVDQRLEIIKEQCEVKLQQMVPQLKESKDKEIQKFVDQYNEEMLPLLLQARMEYLSAIHQLAQFRQSAQNVRFEYDQAIAGVVEVRGDFLRFPQLNLFDEYTGQDYILGIRKSDVLDVFEGRQTPQLKLFLLTGEVLRFREEAEQRLKELEAKKGSE